MVEAEGGVWFNTTYTIHMIDPSLPFENHTILVFMNKLRAINEGPHNYDNNKLNDTIVVVPELEKEEGEREEPDVPILFVMLITLLAILWGSLVIVVRAPDRFFKR